MVQSRVAQTCVALLRGINAGGKNIVSMAELAGIFREAGCAEVRTYIQSGNVLFSATAAAESTLPAKITQKIEARFGYRIPVVLRTVGELSNAIAANPFLASGVHPRALHVYFLRDTPAEERVAALDLGRSLPDTFALRGREVYLNLPNGMARTRLTNAYFDFKLSTVSTARNWNTVLKLLDLMKS